MKFDKADRRLEKADLKVGLYVGVYAVVVALKVGLYVVVIALGAALSVTQSLTASTPAHVLRLEAGAAPPLVEADLQPPLVEADLQVGQPLLIEASPQVGQGRGETPERHGGLFPPTDLGLLETPDRAAWQKPEQIMDALKIADRMRVADIGAGAGFFTIRLARRVGPNGRVYAQDIQQAMLEAIKRRLTREGLLNVETVLGTEDDPRLPRGILDAVLVVDSYQEVDARERVRFLRNLAAALKPGGRLGIVNYKAGKGGPGPDVRVDSSAVEADAREANLRVIGREDLPFQYLLILGR